MGSKWYGFWRERLDLVVLALLLLAVYGAWFWGTKMDQSSENRIGEVSTQVSNSFSQVVAENSGVMKAAAGFYFGSTEVKKEESDSFFDVLFAENVWGKLSAVELWSDDGKLVGSWGKRVPERGQIVFEQKFDQLGRKLRLVNYVDAELVKEVIGGLVPEDMSWKLVVDDLELKSGGANFEDKNLERKSEVTFGGRKIQISLGLKDVPGKGWNLVLGLGGVLSFLIYILVFGMFNSGKKAQVVAEEMVGDILRYKRAVESLDTHLVITDVEGKVLYANQAASNLTGYDHKEIIGSNPRLWGRQMPLEYYQKMWKTIKDKKEVFKGEIVNRNKQGGLYTAYAVISPILDENKELVGFVGSETDITERKRLEDEQKRMNELMVGRELRMVELKKRILNQKSRDDE